MVTSNKTWQRSTETSTAEEVSPGWWHFPQIPVRHAWSDHRLEWRAALQAVAPTVGAEQTHGCGVAVIDDRPETAWTSRPRVDALLTNRADVRLAVRTADCAPVLLWDPEAGVGGVAHMGWRGLAANVLTAWLDGAVRLGARPARLWCGIGPAARSCCYEVGGDVAGCLPDAAEPSGVSWRIDLVRAARRAVVSYGVAAARVVDAGVCTICDVRWPSYRRCGDAAGRIITTIGPTGAQNPERENVRT